MPSPPTNALPASQQGEASPAHSENSAMPKSHGALESSTSASTDLCARHSAMVGAGATAESEAVSVIADPLKVAAWSAEELVAYAEAPAPSSAATVLQEQP